MWGGGGLDLFEMRYVFMTCANFLGVPLPKVVETGRQTENRITVLDTVEPHEKVRRRNDSKYPKAKGQRR